MDNPINSEKHLSEVLNKLIYQREEVIRLNHRINQLESGLDFRAEVHFEFVGNKRSSQRYWLNKGEMLLVLNRILKTAESNVEEIEVLYNEIKTPNNG